LAGTWLCLGGAAIGLFGLIGWLSGTAWLTTIFPGLPPVMPNTALALLLIGGAGAARQHDHLKFTRLALSMVAGVAVLTIGVSTLAAYAFVIDLPILGVGQVLTQSSPPFPLSSPISALALTFLATAFLLVNRPNARTRVAEWLVLLAAQTAFIGLTGIILGASPLDELNRARIIGLSLPSAIGLLLISFGLLSGPARAGIMRAATSPGPGGSLIRRLALPIIIAPIVLGLFVTRVAALEGVTEAALPVAIFTAMMTTVSLAVLFVSARPLDRAHEHLQASLTRISQLVEDAPDGIFVADLEGRYTEVNEIGCRLIGYTREEILGKTILDLIPASDVPRLWQAREALLQGGAQVDEWTIRRRDGTLMPVEISTKILPDGRWQAFVRDISERKRLAAELQLFADLGSVLATTLGYQETAARVAEVAVHAFADICIVDLIDDAGDMRRLSVVSRHPSHDWFCQAIGHIPADQPRPALIESLLESRQPCALRQPTAGGLAGLAYGSDQLDALRAIDVQSLMVIPLIAREQLLGAVSFFSFTPDFVDARSDLRIGQKIADRTALAIDNTRLYQKAQLATHVRDEVLGIVAHDLRNPLSMILLEARLLGGGGRQPERRSEQPGLQIERAAMRMSRLIQDLLDVTRAESGRLGVEPRRTAAARVVTDAADEQRALAASASLELRLELPPDLPAVLADRDRLLQVFENLIGNAIKFTPPHGCITVGASREEGAVRFWVRNTGPGIAVELQPHLFDRFWQQRTARRGGAGLGLRIVKGIVEAHNGRVWVESTPGSESTFLFTIPIARLQESATDLAAIAR
jgi:PAS domain S-box-containing protein